MNERELLGRQLYGVDSHVHLLHGLEGLPLEHAGARIPGAPYSIFEILNHMIFWQDVALARIAGRPPARPRRAADGWPGAPRPETPGDWESAVTRLAAGLDALERHSLNPDLDLNRVSEPERKRTVRQEIFMTAGHNSYHFGQIAILRRQLGSWPPPRGGETW